MYPFLIHKLYLITIFFSYGLSRSKTYYYFIIEVREGLTLINNTPCCLFQKNRIKPKRHFMYSIQSLIFCNWGTILRKKGSNPMNKTR